MAESTCRGCGSPLPPSKYRPRIWCSARCRGRAQDAQPDRKARPGRGWKQRICAWCGQQYATRSGAEHCSRHCAQLTKNYAGKSSPIPWRNCEWCGEWFIGRVAVRRHCSRSCADMNQPRRAKVTLIAFGTCAECGSSFVRRATSVRFFCGDACSKRARKRVRKHRQRAIASQIRPDRITILELAQRDGWTCHICGRKTDRKRGNGPDAPSIDHLVPVSAGGSHTWDNVALAHRHCNSLRGTGGTVQLRLSA